MTLLSYLDNASITRQFSVIEWMGTIAVLTVFILSCQAIYNLYFHPLAGVPGPLLARASRLWYVHKLLRGSMAKEIHKVHEKYGKMVRIAPDELVFTEPDAWKDIYGHRAGKGEVPKDPNFYNNLSSRATSIINAPGARHGEIRRLLSYGFSEKALREQEVLVQGYCTMFLDRLDELRTLGAEIDMVKWYNFFTFDVIGDLAFGEAFGCLKSSDYHPWIICMFRNIKATAFLRSVDYFPFLKPVKQYLVPKELVRTRNEHRAMTVSLGMQRRNTPSDRIDFMSRMTKENGISDEEFVASTGTLVIAGSETTATLLSGLTHQLLMNPKVLKTLTNEVRTAFAAEEDINFIEVGKLKYLMACLEEALRFYPAAPEAFPRRTKVGEEFYGQWVPAETTVSVYHYAAYHSTEHFFLADQFIPERWLGDERFKNDHKNMMQPFSFGPRNCLGKNLAIVEMRLVLSRLIYRYDLEIEPGHQDWDNQRTWLLWEKGPLRVKLTPAKAAQ
ncbi:cytochrome P450 ClCP1 [Phlyctema vagabunda]|uniref:Cytochrome P450 ClCP1 n=1 Tax=Phlyctema vagabunda TaxID=108571 RepID=A0ABR4PP45_9HELO